jgi:hypothetical protein
MGIGRNQSNEKTSDFGELARTNKGNKISLKD